jgi:hypothetical protein
MQIPPDPSEIVARRCNLAPEATSDEYASHGKEKMPADELYRSIDLELQSAAAEAQQHLGRLNATPNEDVERRRTVLRVLVRSIAVRDLPANVLAVGNPCRVIRQLS